MKESKLGSHWPIHGAYPGAWGEEGSDIHASSEGKVLQLTSNVCSESRVDGGCTCAKYLRLIKPLLGK